MSQLLLNVEEEFKKLLKMKAVEHDTTMKAIVIEAVNKWIQDKEASRQ